MRLAAATVMPAIIKARGTAIPFPSLQQRRCRPLPRPDRSNPFRAAADQHPDSGIRGAQTKSYRLFVALGMSPTGCVLELPDTVTFCPSHRHGAARPRTDSVVASCARHPRTLSPLFAARASSGSGRRRVGTGIGVFMSTDVDQLPRLRAAVGDLVFLAAPNRVARRAAREGFATRRHQDVLRWN